MDTDQVDFTEIPAAGRDAEIDPHWLELRADSLLPAVYMPPAMAGRHGAMMRLVATALIGIFTLATTLGVCLTYGPPT